jgi:hypothetical protein
MRSWASTLARKCQPSRRLTASCPSNIILTRYHHLLYLLSLHYVSSLPFYHACTIPALHVHALPPEASSRLARDHAHALHPEASSRVACDHAHALPPEASSFYLLVGMTAQNPDPKAAEYFAEFITKAYTALTDETARENYAKYGHPDGPQAYTVGPCHHSIASLSTPMPIPTPIPVLRCWGPTSPPEHLFHPPNADLIPSVS